MDNLGQQEWVILSLFFVVAAIAMGAFFAGATGALCGWLMSGLTVRRGIVCGLMMAVPVGFALLIYLNVRMPDFPLSGFLSNVAFIAIVVGIPVAFCYWRSRRVTSGS